MKKLFVLMVAAVMSANVMAQHEIGVVAGGLNGLSYKYWFSDRAALQTDLAVGLSYVPGALYYSGNKLGDFNQSIYDFTVNPNLLYHFPLADMFQLYVGGGVNLGMMSDIQNTDPNGILGKFGVNAAVGFAVPIDKVVIAFDVRPGYGLGFQDADAGHLSFFDWKLGLAVRYSL